MYTWIHTYYYAYSQQMNSHLLIRSISAPATGSWELNQVSPQDGVIHLHPLSALSSESGSFRSWKCGRSWDLNLSPYVCLVPRFLNVIAQLSYTCSGFSVEPTLDLFWRDCCDWHSNLPRRQLQRQIQISGGIIDW